MKAYDASFPLNVNFFMKNLKTLIFGATYYAKTPKDSPNKGRGWILKLQRWFLYQKKALEE